MPAWPPGWKRTTSPRRAAFASQTIAGAMHAVLYELKRAQARDARVDHDMRLNQKGLPYSDQKQPEDKGVVVYFTTRLGRKVAMPCDAWDRVEHNLWAVARTLEAKRGIERWGTATQEAEYQGYAALPAGDASQAFGTQAAPAKSPRVVLEVRDDASLDACEAAWKAKARKAHPDAGGSNAAMVELNAAITAIREGRA